MNLLMQRASILAQGTAPVPPPVSSGSAWELDITRTPAGYTLSDSDQTAINTSGGSDYRRWVPSVKAITPADGRRYWEVACAPSGAGSFNGYMGVVSAQERDAFDADTNPVTRGSIGWRGNGTLWASDTASAAQQRLTGLPSYGAGDVLMFVFDPASASLWIGKNGVWRDDPVIGSQTWTSGGPSPFYPQIQGRDPGDGGTLRSLANQFSYPVPSGVEPLGAVDPTLRIYQSDAFLEIGWDSALSIAAFEAWRDLGGGAHISTAGSTLYLEQGGSAALTASQSDLYLEVELP
jgi:hypothetical protein